MNCMCPTKADIIFNDYYYCLHLCWVINSKFGNLKKMTIGSDDACFHAEKYMYLGSVNVWKFSLLFRIH